ncbi:TatD family hydrolase [Spiroplasma endosymbiont of Crioceris asparagi]|uniref:TatD family hydrolase n=1 Tax=Spiroplasma endosymbiont of Crioceris asparagi TaxID=3066286 RepID=UPI0030CA66D7
MNGIIDCHTHLGDELYEENNYETATLMHQAKNNGGVSALVCSGYDVESSRIASVYTIKYKNVFASVGIHPSEAKKYTKEDLEKIDELCKMEKTVAVGEIGLDYYYTDKYKKEQLQLLKEQIIIANKNKLPVVLHIRDQKEKYGIYDEVLEVLKEHQVKHAMVHCFSADWETAEKFIKEGYKISISGVVTFDNAKKLHEVVKKISLQDLVVETDAPYLAPTPHRGKINVPEYIILTVKRIAELKNIKVEEVIDSTRENAKKFFNILK